MAEAQLFASQDEMTCSLCLEALSDPVSILCGHSFCHKSVKSCLTCMISYCPTHLQPHFEIAAWNDHKLTNPVENLKKKICAKHQKSLEMFCEADGTCICVMCSETEHEGHKMVMLEMEKKEKRVSWVYIASNGTEFCFNWTSLEVTSPAQHTTLAITEL
uniref:Uncharacterized protein n=1 Tax=Erpetoichthys calabaricus TaxID=27687 RepID=A0A8C4TGC9_ERPCA